LPVGGLIFPSIDKKAHDCSTTGFLQAVLTLSQPARDGYCGSILYVPEKKNRKLYFWDRCPC